MKKDKRWLVALAVSTCAVLTAGCKPKEPPPPPPAPPLAEADDAKTAPSAPQLPAGHPPLVAPPKPPVSPVRIGADGLPAGHPEIDAAATAESATARLAEAPKQFVGITITPPKGWQALQPPKAGAKTIAAPPVGIFVLPRTEGDEHDAMARLTHYPGMRSIPLQQNLNRWYAQVKQPDGRPTKDVAELETFEAGGATITLVDIPGTLGKQPNQRMLAAVIEHPQGPHFLKVSGPDATVRKWKDSVRQYLQSIQVTP